MYIKYKGYIYNIDKESKNFYISGNLKFNKLSKRLVGDSYNFGYHYFELLNEESYKKYLKKKEINEECDIKLEYILKNIRSLKK